MRSRENRPRLIWGCFCQDRAGRFVVAWASGPPKETLAESVVTSTRCRNHGKIRHSLCQRQLGARRTTIETIYREREPSGIRPGWDILRPTDGIRLTQAIKHRKGRQLERIEIRATIGKPVERPYAVHVERLNGTLRDRLNCLARKTHAFARDVMTRDALFSLALFEHNWLRPHVALRVPVPEVHAGRRYDRRSPAMALGLTDHVWSWDEFLRLPVRNREGQSHQLPRGLQV
jgi:hypothetical protein